MCELLVSISEIVTGILILINCFLPINTGLSASAFVKCLKCLTGLSFENESDLEEYRLFAVKWIFMGVIGLISMFACLFTLEVLAGFTDYLKSITHHQLMLMIYHYVNTIVNLSMIISTHGFTSADPGHLWEFIIYIFSILDIIQSSLNFFITLISWYISRKSNSINPEF